MYKQYIALFQITQFSQLICYELSNAHIFKIDLFITLN